jgi:hypothetical protein
MEQKNRVMTTEREHEKTKNHRKGKQGTILILLAEKG